MRVEIDHSRCAGYGNCVDAAPAVFDLSDVAEEGIVLDAHPGPEQREAVLRAARVCPADAVVIEDNDA